MAITAVVEWDHTFDSTPGAGSQATSSHSFTVDYLYVAFITQMRTDSVEPPDPTLSTLGGSAWTEVSGTYGYWDQTPASMRKTSIFHTTPGSSSSGAVTVSYGTDPDTIDIIILECAGADTVAQVVDWTGSWTGSGALNERITMATAGSANSRILSMATGNVALVAIGSPDNTTPRPELSSDTGGDVNWTTFSYAEYASSPTSCYLSGYYDGDPADDTTPGFVQFDASPAAAYMAGVEVTVATASPTSGLPHWGWVAAQGTAPVATDPLWIGAVVDQGAAGGGPVGETDAAATARFNGYLTAAYGAPVGIQIGRRYSPGNPSNFASVAEFAQDTNNRHRAVSIKGPTTSQPTEAQITTFMNSIPVDGYDTWVFVHHEPENDGGTHTIAWFQTMCNNLHAAWSAVGRDDIKIGVSLMSWLERDGNGSTTSSDWFPATGIIADFSLWLDPYDETGSDSLQTLVGATLALWFADGGIDWGISETGSVRTGVSLANWIHQSIAYCRSGGALGWCWFHSTVGIGVLLNDTAGRLAMAQEIVASGG